MKIIIQLSLCFLILGMNNLQANDASFMGKGADVSPVKETKIQMVAEDIMIVEGDKGWEVKAKYWFSNPTEETVDLQVGFPEYKCDGDCAEGSWTFHNLKTLVQGKEIKHRIGEVQANPYYDQAGRVYLFDVQIKSKEVIAVEHNYFYEISSSVEGRDLFYITRTGALWNGPIGNARFTVIFNNRPYRMVFPPEYLLQEFTEKFDSKLKQPRTKVVFEMKNWTPTRDFDLAFDSTVANPYLQNDCPHPSRLIDYDYVAQKNVPLSDKEAIAFLTSEVKDPDVCRNLIYAIHGYPFKNKKWSQKFYAKPRLFKTVYAHWERTETDETFPKLETYQFVGMQENPGYSDELIRSLEKRYVDLLKTIKK